MRELVELLGGGLGSWPIHAFLYTALLGGAVLLVERRLGSLAARETWLRVALFGGVAVASAQLALSGKWSVARMPLSVAETAGPRALIGLAGGSQHGDLRSAPASAGAAKLGEVGSAAGTARPLEATAPSPAPWPWLETLVALWAAVAVTRLARLALRRRRAGVWLASRKALRDPALRARVQRLAGRRARVRLSEHDGLDSPIALGAGEICLPARAVAELEDDALDAVLAHELAHLARRDDRWSLAAQVAEALALPFAAAARRRLQHVAELACDASAARAVGELAVARGLERVASWIGGGPALALGAAMARADSDLTSRVARVLERGGDVGKGARRNAAAALALVGVLACVGPRAAENERPVPEDPPRVELAVMIDDDQGGVPLEVPVRDEVADRSTPQAVRVASPQVHVGEGVLLVRDGGALDWVAVHDGAIPTNESPVGRPSLLEWLRATAARMDEAPGTGLPAGRLSISTEDATRMHDVLRVMERCGSVDVRIWNLVLVATDGREWATPLPNDLAYILEAIEEVPEDSGQLEPVERPEIRIRVVEPGTKLALDGGPWSGTGPYRHDTDRVLEVRAGPRKLSLSELSTWLAARAAESPGVSVIVDCRPGVVYGDLLPVLDMLGTHGLPPTWVGAYDEVHEDPPAEDK